MQRRYLISSGIAVAVAPSLVVAQAAIDAARPVRRLDAAAGEPQKLAFGLITPRNAEQTLKNWNPFIDRMSKAVGLPIERRTYATQGELVKDFLAGQLELAWLGNAPALEIVEADAGGVFAAMVVQGKTAYRSLLLVHQDSPVRTLADVIKQAPQMVFGDGDIKSTSGHIVPKYFAFVKKGVNDPEKIFKEVRRGSHESNQLAVARREVDIATNNTSELDNFRTSKPELASLLRVVWESPDIPESPMIWRTSLSPMLKSKIASFTYNFGAKDDEEKGILWNINKLTAFRRSSNRQLVTIADLEMFNARQAINNNQGLTPEQKALQTEAVTKRGSKLELMLKRAA